LVFYCDKCNIYCDTLNLLELHNLTKNHTEKELCETDICVSKNPMCYNCVKCDYTTHNKKDYIKHTYTRKHLILTGDLQQIPKNPNTYNCDCGKKYNHRQSLHNHKKVCKNTILEEENTTIEITNNKLIQEKDEIIKYLINENKEFKNLILEIVKKDTNMKF
jgi:hypothetical protein